MELIYAFGIAFESEGASGKVRQEHRRNAHEIINDLALGETYLGVEDFIQIGKLDLTAFNFDERFLFSQLMLPWQILPQATQITMIRDEEIRMSHFSTQQSALSIQPAHIQARIVNNVGMARTLQRESEINRPQHSS